MKITCFVSKNGANVQLEIGHICTEPFLILYRAIALEISSARSPPFRYNIPSLYFPLTHGIKFSNEVTALDTM